MNRARGIIAATLVMGLVSASGPAPVGRAADALQREAAWQKPSAEVLQQTLRDMLAQQNVSERAIEQAAEVFAAAAERPGTDSLDAFVLAAADVTPAVEQVLQTLQEPGAQPEDEQLNKLAAPLREVVEVYAARHLVRQRLFDEALPLLVDVQATTFLDPATVLFYRAASQHALLHKDAALADLRLLLENDAECPLRFARTAKLMLADIKPLKPDSLDEISRLMGDVQRRLDLGRVNDQVQQQEQEIIDKLTKLIDKIEQQQQQQQQQQQSSSGGSPGGQGGQSQAMQDSQAAGGSGAGDVDSRDLGDRAGWGKLPPAQRQEALQQIGRDLPTHYRDAIEAYFRKLATDQ
ncbi:hypothetical protein [Roseimaritima sediminicola]|uniref:hypothetical protein n=1 Tax=Roseimaritima sediminicola TaxID=2662066 RepID=UPI00129841F8|nr:hypothetical protein [Roseimaritima sediminicola]